VYLDDLYCKQFINTYYQNFKTKFRLFETNYIVGPVWKNCYKHVFVNKDIFIQKQNILSHACYNNLSQRTFALLQVCDRTDSYLIPRRQTYQRNNFGNNTKTHPDGKGV